MNNLTGISRVFCRVLRASLWNGFELGPAARMGRRADLARGDGNGQKVSGGLGFLQGRLGEKGGSVHAPHGGGFVDRIEITLIETDIDANRFLCASHEGYPYQIGTLGERCANIGIAPQLCTGARDGKGLTADVEGLDGLRETIGGPHRAATKQPDTSGNQAPRALPSS